MEDTGRIRRSLHRLARPIVFGDHAERRVRVELPCYLQADRAHAVMLVEAGLLPRPSARRLLAALETLAAEDHAPLKGRPAPRGLAVAGVLAREAPPPAPPEAVPVAEAAAAPAGTTLNR